MRSIGFLVAGGALLAPAAALAIVTGALDPTFGANGKVDVPGYGVAVQSDGKIVTLGAGGAGVGGFGYTGTFSLARLTSTGAIDFARTDPVGSCSICGASALTAALTLQPDGRILSAGTYFVYHVGCTTRYFVVARHLSSGDLDTSFGSAGVASMNFGAAHALALQPDGRPVIAGGNRPDECFSPNPPAPWAHRLARLDANGSLDASFGNSGSVISALVAGDNEANAVALRPDGKIVAAGYASNGANKDMAVAVYDAAGTLEASSVFDLSGADDVAYAVVVQPDGNFVVGGAAGTSFVVARFTAPGVYDPAFAGGGEVIGPGPAVRALALQADGKIVAALGNGDVLRFGADGAQDQSFGIGGRVSTGIGDALSLALQADGRIVVGSTTQVARIDTALASPIGLGASMVDFAGQSMRTTSPPRLVALSNDSGSLQTIASITATAGFAVTHDCTSLAPGASCLATVAFTPVVEGPVSGDLVVTGSAGTQKVYLVGTGERSLTTHYYQSILRRAPEPGGKAFWDSEAARVAGLGANVNETWFAMAMAFYNSAEYAAFGRDDTGFVTDLYNTFFNRAPDPGGLAYWTGLMAQGMPRDVVLASFMFSPEFASFTQAIFGMTVVRAEIDTVMDFYRGLLGRLPDSSGFTYWRDRFRAAQCQGSPAVYAEVENISRSFVSLPEYQNRARTPPQYVADLYNTFLRRGGDLQGVQYWIDQLNSGALTREGVRQYFIASPEFSGRVRRIVGEMCLP